MTNIRELSQTLPDTFQERGLAIAFTTLPIRHARLRVQDDGSWETLLPGLSSGQGAFLVPWDALREMICLTLHDRAVIELLAGKMNLTPAVIRQVMLEVKADGYDGPDPAERARKALNRDEEIGLFTHGELIIRALEQLGDGAAEGFTLADMATEEGMKKARAGLKKFADSIGKQPGQVMDDLEEWGRLTAAVGTPDGGKNGYLGDLTRRLKECSKDLQSWLVEEPSDSSSKAQRCAEALTMTVNFAEADIGKIQKLAGSMGDTLTKWPEKGTLIQNQVDRLSWLLDGWTKVADQWESVMKAFRYEQRLAVQEIIQFQPILPKEVLSQSQRVLWAGLKQQQVYWQKTESSTLLKDVDPDTKARLEEFPLEDV